MPEGGGVPDRVARGLPTRGQGSKVYVLRNINIFVRIPRPAGSGTRPGGSVTGVTEKLFMCQMLRSPRSSAESRTPKTRKVSKKSPERSLGPPDPGPRKSPKKVRKVEKESENQLFSRLFGFFLDFFGVRGLGVPNSSRETFLRLFGFSGFWTL